MASLFFVIFLIITILVACGDDDAAFAPGLLMVGSLVLVVISIFNVVDGRVIDNKIAMYQEENTNIETQMDILIERYMDYESETFGELKGESSITLVSLYPELKADKLVEQQIEVYTSNNKKIKELKESKINVSKWKWWLYFGS